MSVLLKGFMTKRTLLENGSQLILCVTQPKGKGMDESTEVTVHPLLAAFFYWLAARLEKKHTEAVVRFYAQDWSHMGKSAVTTKRDAA